MAPKSKAGWTGVVAWQAVLGLLLLICARLLRNYQQMVVTPESWMAAALVISAVAWLVWLLWTPRGGDLALTQQGALAYALLAGLAGVALLVAGSKTWSMWCLLAAAPGFWAALFLGLWGQAGRRPGGEAA